MVEGIKETGISPSPEITWFINPDFWHVVLEESENELKEAYQKLPGFWEQYEAGENEFISRVRMVGYFGEILHKRSTDIQEIKRQMQYLGMIPSKNSPEKWIEYYNSNTEWARKFLSIGEFKPRE